MNLRKFCPPVLIALSIGLAFWLLWAAFPPMPTAQAAPAAVIQSQVILTPAKDNTLFESGAGNLSSGIGSALYVGKTKDGLRRRGLLAFNLTGQIPPGATIVSVTLRLSMFQTNTGAQTVALHKATRDWGEGSSNASDGKGASATTNDATWLHTFFNTQQWQAVGGDFSATASASTSVSGNGVYTWGSTPGLVADVQGWLNNPATNFGWFVIGNEAANKTAKAFGSREQATAGNRPQLTIVYETGAATATATPTATPTATTSVTPSPTASATPSPSITPSATASPTPSLTSTGTVTPPTLTPTVMATATASSTPKATGSPTPLGSLYLPVVGNAPTPTPTQVGSQQ